MTHMHTFRHSSCLHVAEAEIGRVCHSNLQHKRDLNIQCTLDVFATSKYSMSIRVPQEEAVAERTSGVTGLCAILLLSTASYRWLFASSSWLPISCCKIKRAIFVATLKLYTFVVCSMGDDDSSSFFSVHSQ